MSSFDPNNLGHQIDSDYIKESNTEVTQYFNYDNDTSAITVNNTLKYYINYSAYMYECDGSVYSIVGKFNYVSQERGNTWDFYKLVDHEYVKVYQGEDRHVENLLHEELRVAVLLQQNKI